MEDTKLDEYFFAMMYSPLFGGHGMRTIVLRGKHQQPRQEQPELLAAWELASLEEKEEEEGKGEREKM